MENNGLFRTSLSDVTVVLDVKPKSPLLIQAPRKVDDGNKIYALSYKNKDGKIHYIPGSSIKGVFRSYTEKVFYHLLSIDPESDKEKKLKDHKGKKADFYYQLNPVNQLFGFKDFKGRLTIEDAYFDQSTVKLEKRTNIAIDRFRGGQKNGALFEPEMIIEGSTKMTIRLKNPYKWQIFWLFILVRDFQEGRIRVGSKSSIGFGEMDVDLVSCDVSVFSKSLIEDWESWLTQGIKLKKESNPYLYQTYMFSDLDKVAILLEEDWKEYIKKYSEEKEGVSK